MEKVLIIDEYYQPSIGYQPFFLAKALKKKGYDVSVVTSDRFFPFSDYELTFKDVLGTRIRGLGISIERGIRTIRLPILFEYAKSTVLLIKGFKRTFETEKPDLILACNAFTPCSFQIAQAVSGLKKKPVLIFDSHASTFNTDIDDSFLKKLYITIFRHFLSKTIVRNAALFAPIGSSEEYLLKKVFPSPITTQVVPLGADTTVFVTNNDIRTQVRKRLRFHDDDIVIIYAGKISSNKDIDTLLNSFFKLSERNSRVKLVLIGSGNDQYITQLKNQINEARCNKAILWIDFVKNQELVNYYNAADIGIWPGNLSNTIQEAMATGLPVILPKNVSESQTTDHLAMNEAAVQFARGDILNLSNKMIRLVEDQKERELRSKNCYNLIRTKYSWDVIAEQYLALYRQHRKQQ